MSASVVITDLFGFFLAVIGFIMAFRQHIARRILGRPLHRASGASGDDEDPLTYVLRIAGVMAMVFGIVIAGMVTLFYFR